MLILSWPGRCYALLGGREGLLPGLATYNDRNQETYTQMMDIGQTHRKISLALTTDIKISRVRFISMGNK